MERPTPAPRVFLNKCNQYKPPVPERHFPTSSSCNPELATTAIATTTSTTTTAITTGAYCDSVPSTSVEASVSVTADCPTALAPPLIPKKPERLSSLYANPTAKPQSICQNRRSNELQPKISPVTEPPVLDNNSLLNIKKLDDNCYPSVRPLVPARRTISPSTLTKSPSPKPSTVEEGI